ncbi:alpha/beta fold hydrolase [Kalamiella sp. sgz302252]|uniref:alpha/beta fold hydrolase n=1 Tax=Pantoea sp. sgz302252 TaxID=3341827 RepID=UPI0036D3994E
MLPYSLHGKENDAPVFVLLHYLGGSGHTWYPTISWLDGQHRCVTLDTPGFGAAGEAEGYDVASMATQFDQSIRDLRLKNCILVGHSMTGKVALALASRQPDYLKGLILVAPSPPGPQPMSDEDRASQINYSGSREEAEQFVDTAASERLPDALREIAIQDAQRANLKAWRAWPEAGSREDWSEKIGTLNYPALLIAGSNDDQVPAPEDQQQLTLSHLPGSRLEVIVGAGHLMPLQTPQKLAELMLTFAAGLTG